MNDPASTVLPVLLKAQPRMRAALLVAAMGLLVDRGLRGQVAELRARMPTAPTPLLMQQVLIDAMGRVRDETSTPPEGLACAAHLLGEVLRQEGEPLPDDLAPMAEALWFTINALFPERAESN